MKASVGDELTVKGRHQGDGDRHGEIIEVHGDEGSPPYVVQWKDGHESVFFPSADTIVARHRPKGGVAQPGSTAQAGSTAGAANMGHADSAGRNT